MQNLFGKYCKINVNIDTLWYVIVGDAVFSLPLFGAGSLFSNDIFRQKIETRLRRKNVYFEHFATCQQFIE